MAPPPEYDKEPKAPDKSATNISCDETKALHNLANDQQTNLDNKTSSTATSADVENNKLVETLDDGQLRALLDEAITYKCPKDREGKSSLFKELLEEVELDEQASEAAARTITVNRSVNRASGRGSRSRRALPHSNSLQDLVAALAAEPTPRRHHRAPPAPAPAPVSTRAIHGGSLPSGVDTSFLLGEEPARGAGYLATVRCVNPPPLAERRVSTDASCNELDSLNRRSKPAFPMTYTARATLEIGSGAVSSGRAVTTTTASNQVRTMPPRRYHHYQPRFAPPLNHPTAGPPERLYPQKRLYYPTKFKKPKRIWLSGYDDSNAFNKTDHNNERNVKTTPCDKEISTVDENTDRTELTEPINVTNTEINVIREETAESSSDNDSDTKVEHIVEDNIDSNQFKLLSALIPKMRCDIDTNKGGGINTRKNNSNKEKKPRGPHTEVTTKCQQDLNIKATIPAGVHTTSIVTSVTIPDLQKIDKNKISPTSSKKILKREENPGKGTKISKKEERKDSINPTIGAKNIKGVTTTKNKSEPTASITSKEATVSKIKDLTTLAAEQHGAHNLVSVNNNEWEKNIINWYGGLKNYCLDSYYKEEYYPYRPTLFEGTQPLKQLEKTAVHSRQHQKQANKNNGNLKNPKSGSSYTSSNILHKNIAPGEDTYNWTKFYPTQAALSFPIKKASHMKEKVKNDSKYNVAIVEKRENMTVPALPYTRKYQNDENMRWVLNTHNDPPPVCESFGTDYFRDNYNDDYLDRSRREYQERIGKYLVVPKIEDTINPRNVRNMTIGKPLSSFNEFDIPKEIDFVTEPKNNECNEEKKLSKESSPTDDNDDHYVLSFEELAISSSKDFAFDRENNKDHQSVGANSSSVSALSFGLDNMHEDLEIFHDSQDVPLNVSVRSNTPEQKYIKFKTNDIIIDQKNEGFSTKNDSQKEDTSVEKNTVAASAKSSVLKETTFIKSDMKPASSEKSPNFEGTAIELVAETYSSESSAEKCTEVASSTNSSNMEDTHGNYKLKKGTVIPLINRPDSVSTDDNNEHLCSSSKEKEPPSEKEKVNQPPQQAQTYTESINVNPIRSYDMLDQEKHVELVDMSSQTQNRKDQIQDNLKEFINFETFSDDFEDIPLSKTFEDTQTILKSDSAYKTEFELVDMSINNHKTKDLNLENVKEINFLDESSNKHEENSFSKYLAEQQRLFQTLEDNNLVVRAQRHSLASNISSLRSSEKVPTSVNDKLFKCDDNNIEEKNEKRQELLPTLNISDLAANYKVLVIKKNDQGQLVLTMPEININDSNIKQSNAKAIEYNCEEKSNNTLHCLLDQKLTGNNLKIEKSKLKKKKSSVFEKTKLETANKKALKAIMFENPSESSRHNSEMSPPTVSIEEVDSAIPFSCITTPEVVASCNTTSSTQSAVAVDPKPLQLASSYRAVTSLVGEPPPRAASPPPALASASALSPQRAAHLLAPLTGSGRPTDQPRGVVTSSFNGLPLSRPNYGSTGNTSQDEYKVPIAFF
ncbi:hypothetical protein O0L34_g15074 [Tuta absoluta]|nr:hypothetical protein O0L34_g15074 [Tuta absoluta]